MILTVKRVSVSSQGETYSQEVRVEDQDEAQRHVPGEPNKSRQVWPEALCSLPSCVAFLQLASRGQQRVNRALNLPEVFSASRCPPQLEGGDGRFEGSRNKRLWSSEQSI